MRALLCRNRQPAAHSASLPRFKNDLGLIGGFQKVLRCFRFELAQFFYQILYTRRVGSAREEGQGVCVCFIS